MKRIIGSFLALALVLSMGACGVSSETEGLTPSSVASASSVVASDAFSTNSTAEPEIGESVAEEAVQSEGSYDINDLNSMLAAITMEVQTVSQQLSDESLVLYDTIGETYDSYKENKATVADFYNASLERAKNLYTKIDMISVDYFKCVAAEGLDDSKIWNRKMEDYYIAWDRGMEDFYALWDELYNEIYDKCEKLIEGAPYKEYADISEEVYEECSNAWDEMYDECSDAWDIAYDNYSSVGNAFYDGNSDVEAILAETKAKQAESEQENDVEGTEQESVSEEDVVQADINAQPVDNEIYQAEGLKYRIYTDGTVEVVGYVGSDDFINIPSTLGGYPVSRIGESAFENCVDICSIIMWPDVISIGKSAFKGCVSLADFSIPSSTNLIDESAFENCTSLASIIIWGGEVIGNRAFKNCTSLVSIDIPSEIMRIGESAFEGCSNLEYVFIWGDNVSIGVNAFANCPKLNELPEGAVNSSDNISGENSDKNENSSVESSAEEEDSNNIDSANNSEKTDAANGIRPE